MSDYQDARTEPKKLTGCKKKNPEKGTQTMSSYIVWNPASRLPPTVIHQDRPTAIKVAGRMAAQNAGEKFYVCKLVNVAELPKPATVKYDDLERAEEDCPF